MFTTKLYSMKRFLIYSLGLGVAVVISSCGGDDPLPAPVPAFEATTDLDIYEVAQPIKFINGSTNASSYTWDFGDGGTSTDINPEYTYEEPGDYIVTLTAITDDEQSEVATESFEVGQRLLTAFGMLSISFDNLDANGVSEGPWDADGSGPDIFMFFGPEDDPNFELTVNTFGSVIPNVSQPFEAFGFTVNTDIQLTNEPWFIQVFDDDSEIEPNAADLMIQATGFNPIINSNTQVDPDQKIGRILIEGGGFAIFLDFEVK